MKHPLHLLPLAAAFLLPACEHKDLCFDHEDHAPSAAVCVRAHYEREWEYASGDTTVWAALPDWPALFGMAYDDLRPLLPAGLRLQTYDTQARSHIHNLPPEGGAAVLPAGELALLFYNNDTEYIVFNDMASYASARATTRTRTRASYAGSPFSRQAEETTVAPPDMLYGHYRELYVAERTQRADTLDVAMHPLVFTYLVRFRFARGAQYVALARGALSGMASGVWLHSGQTTSDEATVLFDATPQDWGAEARVHSFGVPDFPNSHYATRATRPHSLNLELRLKNGKMLSYDFDVSAQVAAQPQGGVITVEGIEVDDNTGMEGGSAFDVDVNGWGEYKDIDISF